MDRAEDLKSYFRRAKRIALSLSLVAASEILFLIYGYNDETYRRISFWEVRIPVLVLIFIVAFAILWARSRRGTHMDSSENDG